MQCVSVVVIVVAVAVIFLASGEEETEQRRKKCGHYPQRPYPIVATKQGKLQGKVLNSYDGRSFKAFIGIPYAAPPTGQLRFKPPQPPLSWKGIRNATVDGSICPQNHYIEGRWQVVGNEDCLFLNVYVPKTKRRTTFPVMVWFHDGAFIWGTGNPTNAFGPDYLMDKDIILVTINYRLGILGFLSTGDDVAPGNWGLKDQVASLQWVKNNIAAFGGDPNSVTIFGGSAGSISVQHHFLSPLSAGLFHRGISQSGVSLMYSTLTTDHREKAFRTGQMLGCIQTEPNTSELVDCLRNKPFASLSEVLLKFWEWRLEPTVTFGPVVEPESAGDSRFLRKYPKELLETGEYSQLPWMTGINPNDGEFKMEELFENETLRRDMSENYRRLLPIIFDLRKINNSGDLAEKIWNFYLGNSSITDSNINNLTDMFSDQVFIVPAVNAATLQASTSKAPVYFYRFDFHGNRSFCDKKYLPQGVCHADDLQFLFNLFGGNTYNKTTEQDEVRIKDIFTELWANFAKTGNPTPSASSLVPFTWTPVTPDQLNFLRIHLNPRMEEGMYEDRIQFWNSLPLPENLS